MKRTENLELPIYEPQDKPTWIVNVGQETNVVLDKAYGETKINSDNALAVANNAYTMAGTAQTNSENAFSTANQATIKADEATATSQAAKSTADSAMVIANKAGTDSTNALNTANGIDGKASEALTKSNQAVNTANTANSTANAAKANAEIAIQRTENINITCKHKQVEDTNIFLNDLVKDTFNSMNIPLYTVLEINFTIESGDYIYMSGTMGKIDDISNSIKYILLYPLLLANGHPASMHEAPYMLEIESASNILNITIYERNETSGNFNEISFTLDRAKIVMNVIAFNTYP